jgi:hypothetical protein
MKELEKGGGVAGEVSGFLQLDDVPMGTHLLVLRKECHVQDERQIIIDSIEKLQDWRLSLALQRAVGEITVEGPAGAQVWLDDEFRGVLPLSIGSVCEGRRRLRVRSQFGSYQEEVDVKVGRKSRVTAKVRPTISILSQMATFTPLGDPDVRQWLAQRVRPETVNLTAEPEDRAVAALKALGLSQGWMSFDPLGRVLPPSTAGGFASRGRQEFSRRLAASFTSEGIGEVRGVPNEGGRRLWLSVLASGSGKVEVLEIDRKLDTTVEDAIRRLDAAPPLFRKSLSLLVVADVADVDGAVIVSVPVRGEAESAGLKAGDVIKRLDGRPVSGARALSEALDSRKSGERIRAEVVHLSGAQRAVELTVSATPCLISHYDRTLLFNKLLLEEFGETKKITEADMVRVIKANTPGPFLGRGMKAIAPLLSDPSLAEI